MTQADASDRFYVATHDLAELRHADWLDEEDVQRRARKFYLRAREAAAVAGDWLDADELAEVETLAQFYGVRAEVV